MDRIDTVKNSQFPSDELLARLVAQMPAVLWTTDRELVFTSSLGGALKDLNLKPGEVVGRTLAEYFGTEEPSYPPLQAHVRALQGESVSFSIQWQDRVFEAQVHPLLDEAGSVVGTIGVALDVTSHERVLAELKQSQARLESLIENTASAIWAVDADSRLLSFNSSFRQRFEEMTGLTPSVGMGVEALPSEEAREFWQKLYGRALAGERFSIEHAHSRAGRTRHLQISFNPVVADGKVTGVSIIATDVTHKTEAEAALRASEERYRSLFERNLAGVFRSTADGRLLDCNPAFAAILGYRSPEEVRQFSMWELYFSPEERQHLLDLLQRDHSVSNFESRLRRKDGRPVWVLENITQLEEREGGSLVLEGTMIDITEMKHLEEQFRQAQKMEAVGRLAGSVAHDFNNALTAIMGYAELLSLAIPQEDARQKDVEEIQKAARNASALTRQLLAFSRKQVISPQPVDLNSIVSGMERMLGRLLGEDIELETELATGLAQVKVDPVQVEQAIMNLAVNARDAMPEGGRLWIRTAPLCLGGEEAKKHLDVEPGDYVLLAVRDNGSGMDDATRNRIFEPFFTTKPKGQGTGLGLSTVYGMVRQSGGYIEVDSQPGQGTEFRIYFPAWKEGPSGPPRNFSPSGPSPLTRRVLLVEDDPGIRELVSYILESKGYRVVSATDGREALQLARNDKEAFDLLLTDLIMPGMGGKELTGQLQRRLPGLKVLYISGFSRDRLSEEELQRANARFLPKPFTPEALLDQVRQLLEPN